MAGDIPQISSVRMDIKLATNRIGVWPSPRALSLAARVARFAVVTLVGFVVFLLFLYRFANPPGSTLMALDALSGYRTSQRWVPLSAISPNLVRAVIAAEDGRFCSHWGIDWSAVGEAIERAGDDGPRGASTISMQTAKNVFLWTSRSYVRKVIEIPLTYGIELTWSKRRILEIYLNIVEWGPGIYGAEAAARHHFNKSASKLTAQEAAQLAVVLPDPLGRNAGDPGPMTSRLASIVRRRMDLVSARCVGLLPQAPRPAMPRGGSSPSSSRDIRLERPPLRQAPRGVGIQDFAP
jgi:monofunctional biosynthetic peptidoglycan transglycosylase